MNTDTRIFNRQLIILALITGAVMVLLMFTLPDKYVSPALPYLLIFHTVVTLLSYQFIITKSKGSPRKFINIYLANTTIKLVLFLAIIFVYSIVYFHDAVNFVVSFFIFYVIFTAFEVYHLTRKSKTPDNTGDIKS